MTTRTKAEIQIHGILAGHDTPTILRAVLAEYPDARTSKACVAWYRSHLRAAALPPTDPKHDKRYVKYLAGTNGVPAGRGQAPAGNWVFVPAEDEGAKEMESWMTDDTQE